jgi:DNA-binding LacI/PurR family transcriptional regulator
MIERDRLWGSRLMGERQLALELGVGRSTLRAALRELEAEGYLERRHGAGTFVAERPAARKRSGLARLAVISLRGYEETDDWQYKGEMLKALRSHAPRMNADCEVLAIDRQEDAERIWDPRYLRDFDGFITLATDTPDLLAHLMGARRGPVVALDSGPREAAVIGVVDGALEGARAVTRHLIALGHRRIAFIDCQDRNALNPWKYGGYRAAHGDRRVPFDEGLVFVPERAPGGYDPVSYDARMRRAAFRAVERWLSMREPPTAILTFSDHSAVPAIEALAERGIEAGRDFAVAGLGDSAHRRGLCDWLTSCRTYPRKMGRIALRLALETRNLDEGRTVIVPNRLMIRRSTCPPPGKK